MLVIGLIIYLGDRKNPFFVQKRFGLNSADFNILKFRTMKTDTPEIANSDFLDMNMYLTRVGKMLRRTSLDELPQLFNVARGQMSFIGPRPLAMTDKEVIELRKASGADQVKPGITGLAQVNGRNQISNDEKAEFDYEYANNLTLRMDARILTKTVVDVFKQTGINANEIKK